LAILALGFAQGLYALDAADGETEHAAAVINVLVQALLQSVLNPFPYLENADQGSISRSPNYDKFAIRYDHFCHHKIVADIPSNSPVGLTLYYLYTQFLTAGVSCTYD
jgi:hypothetical protein